MKKLVCLVAVIGILSSCTPLVVGGVATGATLATQERTVGTTIDDTNIATNVRANIAKENAGLLADVGVEVNRGRVLLTGVVNSANDISIAGNQAGKTPSVRKVINELQVNDGNTNVAKDSWITSKIRSKMLFTKNLKSMNISVETVNGIVYLFGATQNIEDRNKTIQIARTISGVRKVVSHVDVI